MKAEKKESKGRVRAQKQREREGEGGQSDGEAQEREARLRISKPRRCRSFAFHRLKKGATEERESQNDLGVFPIKASIK